MNISYRSYPPIIDKASLRRRFISLVIFGLSCALFLILEASFGLSAYAYWLYHVLYGFGFTFLFYGAFDNFKAASFFTLAAGAGNEFIQDHYDRLSSDADTVYFVQWDHVFSDWFGLGLALGLWLMLNKFNPRKTNKVS